MQLRRDIGRKARRRAERDAEAERRAEPLDTPDADRHHAERLEVAAGPLHVEQGQTGIAHQLTSVTSATWMHRAARGTSIAREQPVDANAINRRRASRRSKTSTLRPSEPERDKALMKSPVIHPLFRAGFAQARTTSEKQVSTRIEPFGALTQRSRDAQPVERQDAARIRDHQASTGSGASTTNGKMPGQKPTTVPGSMPPAERDPAAAVGRRAALSPTGRGVVDHRHRRDRRDQHYRPVPQLAIADEVCRHHVRVPREPGGSSPASGRRARDGAALFRRSPWRVADLVIVNTCSRDRHAPIRAHGKRFGGSRDRTRRANRRHRLRVTRTADELARCRMSNVRCVRNVPTCSIVAQA